MTVLSAWATHRTPGRMHRNANCLSFVALERLNEIEVTKGSGKLSIKRRDPKKLTWEVIDKAEKFEGVGTLRHQICCQLEICFLGTR